MKDEKGPLVSVIVPIFNVEKYVRECLESIREQSYENIEVLMVDDGSTDKSSEICKEYEKLDKRFRLLSKKNGGLSDARNYGLDRMKGGYVCFVDGDDAISSKFVAALAGELVDKKDCLIACCRYRRFKNEEDASVENKSGRDVSIVSSKEYLINTLYQNDQTLYTVSVCTKMFDKKIFEKCRFRVGILYEDFEIIDDVVELSENMALVDDTMYMYRIVEDSITTSAFSENKLDMIHHCEEKLEKYHVDRQVRPALIAMTFTRSFELLLMLHHSRMKNDEIEQTLWGNIKKYRKNIIHDSFVRPFVRISARLTFLGKKFSVALLTFVKYRSIF